MKRFLVFILLVIFAINSIIANRSFDPSQNYQQNNAKAYEGELLVVLPLPENNDCQWYTYFFEPSLFNDDFDSENNYNAIYNKHHLYKIGTEPTALVYKVFEVTKVKQMRDYSHTWIFYLTNINNTSDKVKFIYHGDKNFHKGDFKNFPFLVQKHAEYVCNKLVNKNVYVSTVKQTFATYECPTYGYEAYCQYDINNNPIKYSKSYAKYKVIDIDIDKTTSEIVLKLSDGQNMTTELYTLHYQPDGGVYNTHAKIFTETEWNKLIKIYGESHMSAIMAGDIIEGMTYTECVLSHGQPNRHNTQNSDYNEFSWIFDKQYRTFRFTKSGEMISENSDTNDKVSIIRSINDVAKTVLDIIN